MIVKYKSDNHMADKKVNMELVELDHDHYYKISNHDLMRPFFMSIVSDSNHWMFISSNGGLTAGRKNAEFALFPYYTDDKITESADITGSKSIFQINKGGETILWEPFSERFNDRYQISRNLYKNKYGNKVVFEEITSQNWQDKIPFFIVISLYLFASFWISAKPNYENIGWLGGLINHPFRISDNFNRGLIFLQIILFPGKLLSQGIVVLWKLLQQNRQSDNVH